MHKRWEFFYMDSFRMLGMVLEIKKLSHFPNNNQQIWNIKFCRDNILNIMLQLSECLQFETEEIHSLAACKVYFPAIAYSLLNKSHKIFNYLFHKYLAIIHLFTAGCRFDWLVHFSFSYSTCKSLCQTCDTFQYCMHYLILPIHFLQDIQDKNYQ